MFSKIKKGVVVSTLIASISLSGISSGICSAETVQEGVKDLEQSILPDAEILEDESTGRAGILPAGEVIGEDKMVWGGNFYNIKANCTKSPAKGSHVAYYVGNIGGNITPVSYGRICCSVISSRSNALRESSVDFVCNSIGINTTYTASQRSDLNKTYSAYNSSTKEGSNVLFAGTSGVIYLDSEFLCGVVVSG